METDDDLPEPAAGTVQLIWTGNEYYVAEDCGRYDEVEEHPGIVQDRGGRYHHKEFGGQRVCYGSSGAHFGFLCWPVPDEELVMDGDGDVDERATADKLIGEDEIYYVCSGSSRNVGYYRLA